jgi:hypothetical protein
MHIAPIAFQFDDGGHSGIGLETNPHDGECWTRAYAIGQQIPYTQAAGILGALGSTVILGRKKHLLRSLRDMIGRLLEQDGWEWTPTRCRVHLRNGELPPGRLIVVIKRHWTVVIDGVLHDTFDCSRQGKSCVYGYWQKRKQ